MKINVKVKVKVQTSTNKLAKRWLTRMLAQNVLNSLQSSRERFF